MLCATLCTIYTYNIYTTSSILYIFIHILALSHLFIYPYYHYQYYYYHNTTEFFKSAHSQTIHTLHRPLLDMMLKSSELCKALGKISLFTNILIKRLRYTDEAIVLRSLLKMLQLLYEFHENSKIWVESNNLIALVEEFAKTERKVLVRQLARKLLIDFTQSDT